MHAAVRRQEALTLLAAGLSDSEAARRSGIPRTTLRDWRRGGSRLSGPTLCARCWRPARKRIRWSACDYSELLGLYLGDGHIVKAGRTYRLRLSLDSRYPGIIREARALLERCFPDNPVGALSRDAGATTVLSLYSLHLTCLFPQHGAGKKHQRPIRLEPWQLALIDEEPWAFLRGCIRSDGCVFVNRTGQHSYLSYHFSNSSSDIRGLFVRACERVGLASRPAGNYVRINQRDSVVRLVEHVGTKE